MMGNRFRLLTCKVRLCSQEDKAKDVGGGKAGGKAPEQHLHIRSFLDPTHRPDEFPVNQVVLISNGLKSASPKRVLDGGAMINPT